MHRRPILSAALLSCTLLGLPLLGHAACTMSGKAQTEDTRTAQIPFGKINLTDTYLQPVGSLLGSALVPPTNYTYGGATASTVLWTCAKTDLPNLYFLVATNGDSRVGGQHETGAVDGLSGVYATYFSYVGLKLTMSGVTVSRYWQKVPLTTYVESGNNIQIRLQDIPPLQAELYRISTLPPSGAYACGGPLAPPRNYTCVQPNAYIQLVGPGISHDEIGEDSYSHYDFWGVDNGFGYGMRDAASITQTATCVARNATPLVLFQSISVQQLQAGASTQANFNVQIECSNSAASGTASGQTAIGIQVSPGAYSAAQSLGLVNGSGGVEALVSDNYGNDPNLAQGVGITLRNAGTGTAMVFVGQPGNTGNLPSQYPTGPSAGWYPVLDGANPLGSSQSGYTNYLQTFTASLQQLPGNTATPGKVHATAYVLVKVQ
ncbi:fimbrial protein [Pseudomonas citronellolis]|uniref:fimbrial protein n=1 Tax=Pseudomonas citronellolis TaxID=53408 RepID=UPI000852D283|nr:fimbrial protein [Pseudomonas humi]